MENSHFIKRFLQPSEQSYFIFGPRGTGKSTWLKVYYPDALRIDFLKPEILRRFLAYPERFEELVRASTSKTIIIDEVQKLPEILNIVHSLIEEKLDLQFILTGSSSRKLKRAGVNLLAGRAILRYLHPFMAAELGENFSLESALQNGLVPLIIESKDVTGTLQAYINLYLEEEVKAENLVRNMGHFSRFLEVMSFSHASIINISNIARECEVSRKLIEGYLDVLQDLLLSFQIPVFTLRAKREVVSHPKFYYFDAGIYNSLRPSAFLDKPSEINGPGLEGLVAQHLRAWNDYQGSPNKIFYWRTRYGLEVDFIIYGKTGLYAIEVKNSSQIHNHDLNGLQAFCADYPQAIPLILYRGKDRLLKNKILCMPVETFLKELTPHHSQPWIT